MVQRKKKESFKLDPKEIRAKLLENLKWEKIREAFIPTLTIEWLVRVFAVIGLSIGLFRGIEIYGSAYFANETAFEVAKMVRQAQQIAHERNTFIRVKILPVTDKRKSKFVIFRGKEILQEEDIPGRALVTGKVAFDPEGVPLKASSLSVRYGGERTDVTIESNGTVHIQ